MKKKTLTKKATGGTSNKISRVKPEPAKAGFFSEKSYKEHPIASRVIDGAVMGTLIALKAGEAAVGSVKHVAKKTKKLGVKTSNFVNDTMKKVEKAKSQQKQVKKDVVATAKKQATKSYNAVKNYVPSTVKKAAKK